MRVQTLLPVLLAPLLGGASHSIEAQIAFRPIEGRTLTRVFTLAVERKTESTEASGEQQLETELIDRQLEVRDRVQAVEDGRVSRLHRSYRQVVRDSASSLGREHWTHDSNISRSCQLEGESVIFERQGDEYVASCKEVSDDSLERLVYELDCTALLPPEEARESDEWELDVEAFGRLLDPWRGLPFEWRSSSSGRLHSSSDSPDPDCPVIGKTLDGRVSASLVGTRTVEGAVLAVIELRGELEAGLSMKRSTRGSELHHEGVETRRVDGEALWDIAGGHLHSLEVELELAGSASQQNHWQVGDRGMSSAWEMATTGSMRFTARFELEE